MVHCGTMWYNVAFRRVHDIEFRIRVFKVKVGKLLHTFIPLLQVFFSLPKFGTRSLKALEPPLTYDKRSLSIKNILIFLCFMLSGWLFGIVVNIVVRYFPLQM